MKYATRGFSLLELLLSLAIIFVISASTFPIGMSFYKSQILQENIDGLTTALRRAHIQSLGQKNNSAFGVKIFDDRYVLFKGNSYVTREESNDEIFAMQRTMNITGQSEVVFEQMTGVQSENAIITISIGENEETVTISEYGVVEQ